MYGTNPIAPYQKSFSGTYQIREIFRTIQGEGPFSGRRAIFIRMTGCNLRCHFCDTAWDDEKDKNYTIEEVLLAVKLLMREPAIKIDKHPLIVITGGEPLRQEITPLIQSLYTNLLFPTVQIETDGLYYRDILNRQYVHTVISPKTPKIHPNFNGYFAYASYYKYVISIKDKKCSTTGIPITSTQPNIKPNRLAIPPPYIEYNKIFLSPCEGPDEDIDANIKEVARIAQEYGYIASVRLHTLMGLR